MSFPGLCTKFISPSAPPEEPLEHFYTLRGARYSTIRGELAAQVQLTNKIRRQNHTLYTTMLTKDLDVIKPNIYHTDGVSIKVWKRNNMLYAIARNQE